MVTLGQHLYNTLVLLAYNFLSASVPNTQFGKEQKDIGIREAVTSNGYPFEEYEVKTRDGYLLAMFRLSRRVGKKGNATSLENQPGPPILFLHGFLSSAYDWVVMGPNIGLAYLLADHGYDVWLGNSRGNTYSRNHVRYNTEDPRFWQFSFHEIGYYDIPAKIDFLLKKTGHKSIYYIGHSQGATSMFVTASERPEYIKTIRLFIALAPVVYAKSMPALLAELFATFYKQLEWFVDGFNYHDFLPNENMVQKQVFRLLCEERMPLERICRVFLRANFGYSIDLETVSISRLLNSFPGGASTHQLLHFLQLKLSDSFCQYNHGLAKNYVKYGSSYPPTYHLNTSIPTALIYSDNDWLATEEDFKRISAQLKNIKFKYKSNASHVDYLFGRRTIKSLLPHLTQLLQQVN